jgi:hypothetical protein
MDYTKFKHPVSGVHYAFVVAPAAMLDTEIPVGVADSLFVITPRKLERVDGEIVVTPAVTRQKTLGEFVIKHEPLGATGDVAILLSARKKKYGRDKGVNASDLTDWEQYLTPYGYPSSTWLTLPEYTALVASHTEED